MYGPEAPGHWSGSSARNAGRSYRHLLAGKKYRVATSFIDYDGDAHHAGEAWTFLGFSFLPYEDGLSLFVSLDGCGEWLIRLQLRAEEQAEVVNNLEHHIEAIERESSGP